MKLLEVVGLTRAFGGLIAVNNVSFTVAHGQIKALIGPNGAGKTTIFNIVTGTLAPSRGRVYLDGQDVTAKPPHVLARIGVTRTFQNVNLFNNLSVFDNLLAGYHLHYRVPLWQCLIGARALGRRWQRAAAMAEQVLDRIGLADERDKLAKELPFGKQRMLELGRALMVQPRLLLLDEPAAGLNSAETSSLGQLLGSMSAEGITLLLVEHDMSLVMEVSDEIVVLNFGEKIAEGAPEEIRSNQVVIEAYLGHGDKDDAPS